MKLSLIASTIVVLLMFFSSCGQFAKEKEKKDNVKTDSITTDAKNKQTPDTNKYFELKLVKMWNSYGTGNIKFELKSLLNKTIDNFWVDVSLKSKKGDYLGEKKNLQIDNVKPNGTAVTDEPFIDVNVNNIGEMLLQPYLLQIEGKEYHFEPKQVRIMDNKYGVKVSF